MIQVHIPKMGMSTVEVDVISVAVKIGDRVTTGQILAEVEAEKATVEIESEVGGIVTEVRISPGTSANVGDVVCLIDESR